MFIFLNTPNDWGMVIRVFRYLKGTKSLGLRYLGKGNKLESFSDASFADCKNSITTCGFVIVYTITVLINNKEVIFK